VKKLLKQTTDKILIMVPTVTLVYQLVSDFKNYGFNQPIHTICEGNEKESDIQVQLATWQSLQYMATDKKLPKRKAQYNPDFFKKYSILLGDEAHGYNSTALKNISECLVNCEYRIGLTGTLSESKTNTMVLTGLFGEPVQFKTTSELIEDGTLSEFKIKCITIDYPDEFKKLWHSRKVKLTYQEEISFINQYEKRNSFIAKLAVSLKGNTIVMFRHHEQGKVLFELIKQLTNRNVYYYSGEESGEEREKLRELIEHEQDACIVGSIGAISTGINIIRLSNLIFASPSKSRIKVIQSIGRILRKCETIATLYDISDDIRYGSKKNYAYLHFIERLRMFVSEKFKYSMSNYLIK
jgi:superfamily II DNA or RNA helicase